MRRHRTNRKHPQEGSALVESALSLLLVVYTLFGIVDFGQVLVLHQGLAERARCGARWAAVNPYDAARIQNVVVYNNPQPASNAKPLLYLSTSMVTASLVNSGTTDARIVVTIASYPFRFFTPLVAGVYQARPIRVSSPTEEVR